MKDPIATARAAAAGLDRGSLIDRDRAGTFDRSGWIAVAEAGLTGLGTEYGLAADPPTIARLLAAFGEECHDNGLSLALNAHLWGCVGPLMRFGTERQKAMYGARLCGGSAIGALAATEPDAGSDLSTLSTRAERRDDGYVLNGRKLYVTNAPLADVVIVLAALDPERGPLGAAMFVVERGTPGLDTPEATETMGFRTARVGEVVLNDCRVSAGALLGAEGAGLAIFAHAMEQERRFIMAFAVGAMQRQLDACVRRARARRQFGRAIGDFQQISGKLVDMQLRLETARGLLHRAAEAGGRRSQRAALAAMAKYAISEAWVRNCEDAIQIHGGAGYAVQAGIERELRDAIGSRLFSGTSELQRETMARTLMLG
ncbi:acyl-CoA dehydrogenase family protein [Sphingomonas canadensis]|uniref:Acyl-CoA dehydrogenase family protein n=1 Tax=Sphingomonas canadensis TaxID=1219257 RepID=A0ABW3HBG3_9SPHN|nr:acyl-CoA dehydrogenase family protein [Sphingomonas canadensis]MCW3836907.1 acyl-CoA dehydrogenase family protein [Sphingomonas canadensis]